MKYAVVQIGGKQLQIKEGDTFEIERQSTLTFNVLMFSDDGKVEVGSPFLTDVEVESKITGETRGDKIRIGRFKSKSRYRRIKGHRQPLSVVEIGHIGKKGAKAEKVVVETKAEEKAVPAVKAVKTPVKKVTTTKKLVEKKSSVKKSASSAKKGAVKK
ncbi:MAG: 50S ribosomal protein L21 [Patescibacteria group bacterium]|jgi:large subunit ribosomal protein L21